MDQSNLYVPNYQKWQNYYDKIVDNDKRTDMSMVNDLFYNNSDSSKHSGNSNVSLNLVSPIKMLTEQAKGEIERTEPVSPYKSTSSEKLVQKFQGNKKGNNSTKSKKKIKKSKRPKKSKRLTKRKSHSSKSSPKRRAKKDIFDK